MEYSRTNSFASSGSFSNGNPYLQSEKRVAGVKYSFLDLENVFLIRFDVPVAAVFPDCVDPILPMSLPEPYGGLGAYKLSGYHDVQIGHA